MSVAIYLTANVALGSHEADQSNEAASEGQQSFTCIREHPDNVSRNQLLHERVGPFRGIVARTDFCGRPLVSEKISHSLLVELSGLTLGTLMVLVVYRHVKM